MENAEQQDAQSQDSAVTESPTGDTSAGTAESTSQDAGTTASSDTPSFYSYGEQQFATQEDLTKHLDAEAERGRRERMTMDEYTKRVSTFDDERRKHQEAVKKHEETVSSFSEKQQQYERLDNLLRSRPDVQQQIQQLLGQAPSADVVTQRNQSEIERLREELRQEYAPLLEEREQRQAEEKWNTELQSVLSDTKLLPHGANEEKVKETLDAITNSANPTKEIMVLVARLYANQQAQEQESGGGRRRMNAAGTTPKPFLVKAGMTNDEIEEAQLRAIGQ